MASPTIARCAGILRCPLTGKELTLLAPDELDQANRRIATGDLRHRDGTPAPRLLDCALGTFRREQIYRVEESIVWLLQDLALVDGASAQPAALNSEKKAVQRFYDEHGWAKDAAGKFNDTVQFTETRQLATDYQRRCNARIERLLPGGRYLVDVASGAIPHADYLAFSRNYETRICIDFSIRALREAQAKLGDHGLYLLGDITRLPLAGGSVDTAISLHTVYHVPPAEQAAAVDELVRITRPGGRVVIVYVWGKSVAMDLAFGLRRELGRVRHWLRPADRRARAVTPSPGNPPSLYFCPQDHVWFARNVAAPHRARLEVWSAVSMLFQTHFFSASRAGRMTAASVEWIEDHFPRLAGRYGQYPMFVIDLPEKPSGPIAR